MVKRAWRRRGHLSRVVVRVAGASADENLRIVDCGRPFRRSDDRMLSVRKVLWAVVDAREAA